MNQEFLHYADKGIREEMCVREWIGYKYSQPVKEFFLDILLLREFFFVFYFLILVNNYKGHPKIF
jgi:hypothetical protein